MTTTQPTPLETLHEAAAELRADRAQAAAILGRAGGQSTSKAKQEAAKKNGKKGGRPKKNIVDLKE